MFTQDKSNSVLTYYFLPTALRVMMVDWPHLTQLVIEHGKRMKEKVSATSESAAQAIPSEEQLNSTLNGPFQGVVTQTLNSQARIARVRLAHQIKESDIFPDDVKQNPDNVPERILKQSSLAECDKLTTELDNVCEHHIDAWRQSAQQWHSNLIDVLSTPQVDLSDIELKELADDEPIADIIDRYTDLKVDLPKLSGNSAFVKYYTLKLTVAFHSYLSRLQKPHGEKEIDKLLKPFKKVFKSISQQEKQLLETQQSELTMLLQPINYDT